MNFWPFKKRGNAAAPAPTPPPTAPNPKIVPFSGDLEDTATLKYHGLRALCGVLMDRHDGCGAAHPFCGPHTHLKDSDTPAMIVAHIIPQGDGSVPEPNLIGIYLCQAVSGLANPSGEVDPLDFTVRLVCADTKPSRKMVVQPVNDGSYYIRYGAVLNPVDGDHSTGSLDPATIEEIRGDPEPTYAKWEYYDIPLAAGPLVTIPEFHCLQIRGEWWVVDVDKAKGAHQQLAALTVANNPNHILERPKPGDIVVRS